MATEQFTTKDLLKALKLEGLKEYREYDGLNRPSAIYQANADADNNDKCLKTEYAYDGTSNRITKKKESVGTWNSTWDI